MMLRCSILVFAFVIFQVQASYKDYELVKLQTHTTEQLEAALAYIDTENVDAWKIRKDGSMDLLVTQEQAEYFKILGSTVKTMKNGLEIDELIESQKMGASTRGPGTYVFDEYNDLSQVYSFFDHISEMHPNISMQSTLGYSSLEEEIRMMTISNDADDESLPIILVDAALHGRDWSAVYVAMDIMHHMVMNSDSFGGARFAFIPVLNVDGYKYTWESTDRFWRKSRTDIDDVCVGIDPNRNFKIGFGGEGSSDLTCSDTYRGADFGEEPVSQALMDYMDENKSQIKAYISIHSYGQTIMYPWGYSSAIPGNLGDLDSVALEASANLTATSDFEYTVGSVSNLYGFKSGTSYDYAQEAGVPYVYTIEVRDTGEYGFLLPEDQLTANADEVIQAYLTIVSHALQ